MRSAALSLVFLAHLAFAADRCEVKEYAQYKDLAADAQGRAWLARDYCAAQQAIRDAEDESRLAMQYGAGGRAHAALASADSCLAVMSKTRDALRAAGADGWIKYAYGHCRGAPPSR